MTDGERVIAKAEELGKEITQVTRKAVKNTTKKIKKAIEKTKEEAAELEEIKNLSNAKVKALLKEIDVQSIWYALKDASDEVTDKILPNLSKKAKVEYDLLSEKIKKISKADIIEARKKLKDRISNLLS